MERSHLAPHLRGGPRRSFRYIADLSGAKLGFRAVRRTDPDGGPYLTELVSYGCVATAASGTGVSLEIRTRWRLAGISVLAIPRWSGYSDPRLGCKVFVFLSRSMLRSLPFGSLNAARSPRSSSLEGFSPTRLRVVPSSATQRLFSVAAVARYPPGTGSAQIRPSISANSLRLRCPSANSSQ